MMTIEAIATIISSLFIFTFGSAIGSFLNVVVYRLPANLSLLHPPSRCPHCLHPLGPGENIPILGWLKLKGRCHHCQAPISPRYPLVEAATGLLFCFLFWHFDWQLNLIGYGLFCSWLLALALIDWDTLTLPNPLTQSGLILGLIWTGLTANSMTQFMEGVGGAVLGLWLLEIIALAGSLGLGKTAMGAGDAKLGAMMGAWLGWKLVLVGIFLGFILGAFSGGMAIALGLLKREQPMPFGPFLALGAVITVFYGEIILATYQHFFFPLL